MTYARALVVIYIAVIFTFSVDRGYQPWRLYWYCL